MLVLTIAEWALVVLVALIGLGALLALILEWRTWRGVRRGLDEDLEALFAAQPIDLPVPRRHRLHRSGR